MKLYFRILGLCFTCFLFSCSPMENNIDNSDRLEFPLETPAFPCVKQDHIEMKNDFPIDQNPDIDGRISKFAGSSEINLEIHDVKFEEVEDFGWSLTYNLYVYYFNNSNEILVFYVPPGVSTDSRTMGLLIEVKIAGSSETFTLDNDTFEAYYPSLEDFILIPVNDYHCEVYSVAWLFSNNRNSVSDHGQNIVENELIIPKEFLIRANYRNYRIGISDLDYDSFVGQIVSDWIILELPNDSSVTD